MTLETIYERIRTATSDAEVQRLEKMLDRIVGAIYAAYAAPEIQRKCAESFTAKEFVFTAKEFVS